jgi:small GTP-binding protein
MSDVPFCFKAVLLGDSGVGKTSMVACWMIGTQQQIAEPTVGPSHHGKRVIIEDREVDLLIWHTAGQERFQCLTPLYARSACVATVTTSIIDSLSFDHLSNWINILTSATNEVPPIVLALNKVDLREKPVLSEEQIDERYRPKFSGLFFCSAFTNEEIDNLFMFAATAAYRVAQGSNPPDSLLTEGSKKKDCCSTGES